jgi:Tfp pilus assembly protein PilW
MIKSKKDCSELVKGFTLIEVIIYTGIVGLAITAFVSFALSVSGSRNKTYVTQEVQSNARTAMDIMAQRLRMATFVNTTSSTFGSDPGVLSLVMASSTISPTIIDLTADDGLLQIKEGAASAISIVSDEVKITNLTFTNLTASSTRESIRIQMTMEYNNTSGDKEFNFSKSYQTAVSLRQ